MSPRAHRIRRLWLQIKFSAPNTYRDDVKNTLIRSIVKGDYQYPKRWRVAIGWSNKSEGEMKWGEFTQEMKNSRESSPGFDAAVLSYLENQL
jgi:hypothetical protein